MSGKFSHIDKNTYVFRHPGVEELLPLLKLENRLESILFWLINLVFAMAVLRRLKRDQVEDLIN